MFHGRVELHTSSTRLVRIVGALVGALIGAAAHMPQVFGHSCCMLEGAIAVGALVVGASVVGTAVDAEGAVVGAAVQTPHVFWQNFFIVGPILASLHMPLPSVQLATCPSALTPASSSAQTHRPQVRGHSCFTRAPTIL